MNPEIIPKGTEFLADDGSVVCRALRDVSISDFNKSAFFEWVSVPRPEPGSPMKRPDYLTTENGRICIRPGHMRLPDGTVK